MARVVGSAGFTLDREVQISGAINFVVGLEYHHHQFASRVRSLERLTSALSAPLSDDDLGTPIPTPDEFKILAELHHEAVAYINRVGQLYAFARAMSLDAHLPQAADLLPFRNKHTAHRSMDKPWSESREELQSQAMAFGWMHSFQGGKPVFKLCSEDVWLTFCMAAMHPRLMEQSVALFEAIFPLAAA